MASLAGSNIVVVGGSSGIGLGVAAAALEQGAKVVIVSRSPKKLEAAAKRLSASGHVETMTGDMTREDEVAHLFERVGTFDHLVSTAGAPPPGDPIDSTDLDGARRFVESKLLGAVLLIKHAVRGLRKGGSITLTSGINKDRPPVPGGAVVSAIAGSFDYLARALSLELAPSRVNVVSPGWVDTPMFDELAGDAKQGYFDGMAARLPSGKIATPRDIAPAYLYSMESDFTTGETIHIDGGQRLI